MSKTSIQYWRSRVKKPKSKNGDEVASYCIQFSCYGKRSFFNLHESDPGRAARKARDIYLMCRASPDGIEKAREEYDPKKGRVQLEDEGLPIKKDTVGHLIQAVREMGDMKATTLTEYAKSFRKIVAGVARLEVENASSLRDCEYKKWVQRVDAIKLSSITPEKVIEWRTNCLNTAQEMGKDLLTTQRSLNSCVRNAKSLFAIKRRMYLRKVVELPEVLPFEEIVRLREGSTVYEGKINMRELFDSAKESLEPHHPESYKIMLLAAYCGLRMSEIDYLLWKSIDFDARELRVEPNEFFVPKTADSAGKVKMAVTVANYLSNVAQNSKFVIESTRSPKKDRKSSSYRCKPAIKVLTAWLRQNGVDVPKPIHTLRKEAGSQIYAQGGIHKASRFLRHSNLNITAAYYVDEREDIMPDYG